MTVFSENILNFTAEISDDLFFKSSTRFFGFSLSFPRFSMLVFYMTRISPFPRKKNHFMTLFCSVHTFARSRQRYFTKYWEDGCMGRPPTSNFFWGDRPLSPPRSPPLTGGTLFANVQSNL